MQGCKNCGARAPTPTEVSAAFSGETVVICRCPNDGTVMEPVALFTDPDSAILWGEFESAVQQGPRVMLVWMRDNLAGLIDSQVELDTWDAEQAARAQRAVEAGFDAMARVLDGIERESVKRAAH
jgi:hypothetical protein